jgi:hypothetical protein
MFPVFSKDFLDDLYDEWNRLHFTFLVLASYCALSVDLTAENPGNMTIESKSIKNIEKTLLKYFIKILPPEITFKI